eukprot:14601656-Alexandrium_andersonii.AAC.1
MGRRPGCRPGSIDINSRRPSIILCCRARTRDAIPHKAPGRAGARGEGPGRAFAAFVWAQAGDGPGQDGVGRRACWA